MAWLEWLKGKKSYVVALAIAVVELLHVTGTIDTPTRDAWLVILGAGGVAAIRAAVGTAAKVAEKEHVAETKTVAVDAAVIALDVAAGTEAESKAGRGTR